MREHLVGIWRESLARLDGEALTARALADLHPEAPVWVVALGKVAGPWPPVPSSPSGPPWTGWWWPGAPPTLRPCRPGGPSSPASTPSRGRAPSPRAGGSWIFRPRPGGPAPRWWRW